MVDDASPEPEHDPTAALVEASNRLVRAVDALTPAELAAPSLLPGWTRTHVVAHLALNGDALAGVLRGVVAGEQVPMYASSEQRDADIADLAGQGAAELRDRLLAAVTEVGEAIRAVPEDRLGVRFERKPGGPSVAAGGVAGMRWREVEIHHVDLDVAYTRADWPAAFCVALVEAMLKRRREPLSVHATDLGRAWQAEDPAAPTVRGAAADLGWWLTGRGDGEGVTSEGGALPGTETW